MNQLLLILVPIIIFSLFLAGGLVNTPRTHQIMPGIFQTTTEAGQSAQKSLQLNKLDFTQVQTQQPPTGGIDFSASTLDWEDVTALLTYNNLLGEVGACSSDLNQATVDESGNSAGYIDPPGSGSRVALCWQSKDCIVNGYSAYPPSYPPLPITHISQSCVTVLNNIFNGADFSNVPPAFYNLCNSSGYSITYCQTEYHQIYNDVYNSVNGHNTNCDDSDWICRPLSEFCSSGPGAQFSQFGAICH